MMPFEKAAPNEDEEAIICKAGQATTTSRGQPRLATADEDEEAMLTDAAAAAANIMNTHL